MILTVLICSIILDARGRCMCGQDHRSSVSYRENRLPIGCCAQIFGQFVVLRGCLGIYL